MKISIGVADEKHVKPVQLKFNFTYPTVFYHVKQAKLKFYFTYPLISLS